MQTTPACVFSDRVGTEGGRIAGEEVSSGHAEAKMQLLLEKLQDAVERLQAGGEIPCHFTTLTTAIYHWQDLAACLEMYENAVLVRRHGRRDPLEPAERNLGQGNFLPTISGNCHG